MGLLDSLFSGSQGGGLLDFLQNNAMNQQFLNGGAPGDQAQYGGAPAQPFAPQMPQQMAAQPQMPPPVIQSQASPQPMQTPASPAFQEPSILSRIGNPDGLIARLSGTDSRTIAQRQQAQTANLTFQALTAKGVDPTVAAAAVSPGNTELLKTLVTQNFGGEKFQHVQVGETGLGQKSFGAFNTNTGETKPDVGNAPATDGIGDTSKSGPEYLASLPKSQQGIVQGMIDGTIQPPSSFALAKPYWQTMLAAAKSADPTFDANNWATRHKLSTDMASSGNSSMGGILSNGKSAFAHLSDLSGSMADLGNASHDYPGGGTVAAVQNYLGNKALAGSDTRAKIKAISDNLGHYGQESTKFYSGTGGGVEERMNALKEMNPETTSSEEMASYLAKEKSLMTDRLKQKEAQIRDTMGDGYLAKHPVFTPDLQQTLDTIDGNIAKLNGSKPAVQPSSGEGAIAHNPKTGETIIRKNGKWVPYS